jgi:WD40 repeat protein
MSLRKLKTVGVAVALIVVAVNAATADEPAAVTKRLDLHGDPLPDGAIVRLGTLQRRVVGARIAVSADGKSIISVRGGKYITFWDAASGKRRQSRKLPGNADVADRIWSLSPDGRLLATGGNKDGKQIVVWDVQTGKAIRELLLEKTRGIDCCSFAPDGRRLVSIGRRGEDCCIHVWNLGDGKLLFHKVIQAAGSLLAEIAPDSKHVLAQFSSRRELGVNGYCWEIESGRLLWRSKEFRLNPITFLPDNKLLVWRPTPRCLDLATGRPAELALPPEIPLDTNSRLVFAPDGQTLLLSKGWDVTVWDWRKGKKRHTLKGAWQAQFMPDGKSIVTNNGSLQRWDLSSGKAVWPDTFERGHLNYVIATAFTSDGRRLVSGSSDGTVRLWDVKMGRPLAVWGGYERPPGLAGGPWKGFKLILTPDGDRLLCDAQDGIDLRDTRTGERLRAFSLPRRDGFAGILPIYRVRLSPDGGKVVALAGQENFHGAEQFLDNGVPTNELAIWDLKTGQLLLRRPISWKAKAISPDGRQVLLADGSLLDVETGKEIARMQRMASCFADAFSSDGALIVGGFHRVPPQQDAVNLTTDRVGVWEAATGKMAAHFKPKGPLGLGGFHPDSRYIVLTHSEGVKLWDLLDEKVAVSRRIKGEEATPYLDLTPMYAARPIFARDGRRLATGLDSTILLWDLPAPRMPQQRLEAKVLESLWQELADADAAKAWRAVWRLADAPHDALAFLRGRMKPVRIAAADLTRKLLADLDSDSFEVREAAGKQLEELGRRAEPALRAALKAKPSLEQRRRIEDLIAALPILPSPPAPEELRQLRALIVLERIGTPEARRLLEEAAKGPESARLTRQARGALACLP